VQDDINVILSHALKKASGKPMEDASEILYNAMDKIMEGDLEPDEDDLEEISAEAIEQIQGMAASLQEEIMKAQDESLSPHGSSSQKDHSLSDRNSCLIHLHGLL